MDLSQRIIDHYTCAASVLGRERGGEDGEQPRQAGYSLLWFYRHPCRPYRLNALARAFLGDEAAASALHLAAPAPPLPEQHLLEGAHPLNPRQREAVARALDNPLSIVQGPPGTGKTETILNMASCMVASGATVAVVANNREALANIAEKVALCAEADPARCPNRHRLAAAFAPLGNMAARAAWNEAHPGEPAFSTGDDPEERKARWRADLGCGSWEPRIDAASFLSRHPFITSTVHSLKKCFRDGDSYQFDYVIMDEASQASTLLGLVAMTSARHLVLVGDDEQLAPVWAEDLEPEITRELERKRLVSLDGTPWALKDPESGEGMSILAAAERVLGPLGAPRTFLNEHYRCHPGIIGFCSEQVYGASGEALSIRTPGYDANQRMPVRVRWFEGNYCERMRLGGGRDGEVRTSKRNLKQIAVFMAEEWPELKRRIQADPQLTVCFLSPFNGQLRELGRAISADLGEGGSLALLGREEHAERDPLSAPEVPALTIHRAQGHEFDIVYLLPVEDGDWSWPWSQSRRLINVAVSRAKRELVVMASTCLMSERAQRALTGRTVPPGKGRGELLSPEERAQAEERQRYLKRLMDYVLDKMGAEPEGAFGFHRSRLRSIFDEVPALRAAAADTEEDSACEQALAAALADIDLQGRGLALARNVPLSACFTAKDLARNLTGTREAAAEKRRFVQSVGADIASHLDFVIHERESGRIVLAVEVDGAYHRALSTDPAARDTWAELARRRRRDALKDEVLADMGACPVPDNRAETWEFAREEDSSFILLRLATDGTCALETDALAAGADGAASAFVSIERLLDWQLAQQPARTYAITDQTTRKETTMSESGQPQPTITTVLKQLREEDALFNAITAAKANELLQAAGLIEKCGGHWRATGDGIKAGIVTEVHQRPDGTAYTNCHYPTTCLGTVRSVLARNIPSGARLVPERAKLTAKSFMSTMLKDLYKDFERCRERYEREEPNGVEYCRYLAINFSSTDGVQCDADYREEMTQLIYLLRYMFSYGFEYYLMYRDLIGLIQPDDGLSVISIGCGNGIDYWSLRRALGSRGRGNLPVSYTGFDVIDWSDRAFRLAASDRECIPSCEEHSPNRGYIWQDAGPFLRGRAREGRFEADVICFPKSILEIPKHPESWQALKEALGAIQGDEFYLAFSRPSNIADSPMFDYLGGEELRSVVAEALDAVRASGRYAVDEVDSPCACAADNDNHADVGREAMHWTTDKERDWHEHYPDYVRTELSEMHRNCRHWSDSGVCDVHGETLTRRSPYGELSCTGCDRVPPSVDKFYACYNIYRCKRVGA